ncbi:hypothetical protein [Nocardia stercoris]|uniref:Uncharacterized protein n=1 Tax=Nocardia stercoris TaxID=2483361 RepID=A0A3M2L9Q7_9NOCA|nr:hypothetical protein [Nocardia stercoris]RMI31308.1 hypothetical protein EBN03_18265 [Nocardia stercoris]
MSDFSTLLLAEWRKTVATRANRWLLAGSAALTAGAVAIPAVFPHAVEQTRAGYLTYSGLGLTRLLPMVMILTMTAEWTRRTGLITFTQQVRRSRVLAAKVVVGVLLSLAAATVGFVAATAAMLVADAGGRQISYAWDWPQVIGFVVFVVLIGLVGSAFGALLHHTAAAIVAFFALGALMNLFSIGSLKSVGEWINTGQTYGWVLSGEWNGHVPQIISVTAIWIVVPLAYGLTLGARRDIR